MKLWLGTAQFGLDYGVSNRSGRVSPEEAGRILDVAAAAGVAVIDTAPAYGDSEAVLGTLGAGGRFAIVSKIPQFRLPALTQEQADQARRSIETSLSRLKTDRLYGILAHWPGDLLEPGGELVHGALAAAKWEGLIERIGVSVYEPGEIFRLLERYDLDFIQVPFNLFDQRAAQSGALALCRSRGVSVHCRSAFLQGLLLIPEAAVPAKFANVRPRLAAYHERLRQWSMTPLEACLGFAGTADGIDAVLCGVTSLGEFEEIASVFARGLKRPPGAELLAVDDLSVTDPRSW